MSQIYFIWSNTLHVSDGLSVHHQQFKTVHTATGICQTDTADCLLASRQQYLFDTCLLLYVQSWTADDGRKDRPKHVESYSKWNKFEALVHVVGFTIEMYLKVRRNLQPTVLYNLHQSTSGYKYSYGMCGMQYCEHWQRKQYSVQVCEYKSLLQYSQKKAGPA